MLLDETINIPLVLVCDMIKNVLLLAGISSANSFFCIESGCLQSNNMIWEKLETKIGATFQRCHSLVILIVNTSMCENPNRYSG